MADAGDLERLPPELRNEIYAMVLVTSDSIGLEICRGVQTYVIDGKEVSRIATREVQPRYNRLRILKHRMQEWDPSHGRYVPSPRKTALVCANKKIEMEASAILYGSINFSFRNAQALEWFLSQIGKNKKHLRAIGFSNPIEEKGYHCKRAFNRAMLALEASKRLRTVELRASWWVWKEASASQLLDTLVSAFMTLLKSLEGAYKANNINLSVLDVPRLPSSPCCRICTRQLKLPNGQ